MWLKFLVSAIVVLFGLFYIWAKWKHSYWQRRGVPCSPANFVFGHIKDTIMMRISCGYLLGRLYLEAKNDPPFIGVYIMHKPFLLLRSPEIIKQILVKDFNVFSDRYFATQLTNDPIGNSGLFSVKNPKWRHLRTKLSPAFSSGKLKKLFGLMLESAESLNNYIDDRFVDGKDNVKTIEFRDTMAKYITDVISSVAFGIRTNSFEVPTPEFYIRARGPTAMSFFRAVQLFAVFFFPSISRLINATMLGEHTDYFRNIFWMSMKSREKNNLERGDVIDSLLKLKNDTTQQDTDISLQGDTLVAQSAIFFVAGLETSTTTISLMLWELAKNPKIQDRVRRDILQQLETKGLTYEAVQDMKYLMAAINETLRLYPPAPLIDRVANQDYKIPGTEVVLEKGTVVYAALPGIHMDPKNHPEPHRFDPDRFSEERKNDMKQFTFMPFGEGPRICIGLRIGMFQTAVGLITILRNYEVSLNPDYKNEISSTSIFTVPANGITLNVRKLWQESPR